VAPDAEAVRYRVTWTQLVWLWLVVVVTYGATTFIFWLFSRDDGLAQASDVLLLGLGLAPLLIVASRLMSVTLTPEALVQQNLRRKVMPWTNISRITTESLLGGRSVVVYDHSGRRTRLRAPVTGIMFWDREFETKYRIIGEWYMSHRGQE
jgi:hypothetical protein